MDLPIVTLIAAVCFVLGVLFHKYAVSEAHDIKTHVSNEFSALRTDLGDLVRKELQKVSSKL